MLRGRVDPDLSPDAKPPPIVDEVPVRELADVTRGLPLSDATADQVQSLADSGRSPFSLGQAVRTLLDGEDAPKGLTLEATRRAVRWAKKKQAESPKGPRPVIGTAAGLALRKAGVVKIGPHGGQIIGYAHGDMNRPIYAGKNDHLTHAHVYPVGSGSSGQAVEVPVQGAHGAYAWTDHKDIAGGAPAVVHLPTGRTIKTVQPKPGAGPAAEVAAKAVTELGQKHGDKGADAHPGGFVAKTDYAAMRTVIQKHESTLAPKPPTPAPPAGHAPDKPLDGHGAKLLVDAIATHTGLTHDQVRAALVAETADIKHNQVAQHRGRIEGAILAGGHARQNAVLELLDGGYHEAAHVNARLDQIGHGDVARAKLEYAHTPLYDLEVVGSVSVVNEHLKGQAWCEFSRKLTMGLGPDGDHVTGDFRHELGHAVRFSWGLESPMSKAVFDHFDQVEARVAAEPLGTTTKQSHEWYEEHYGIIGRRALDSAEEDAAEHYRGYHREVLRHRFKKAGGGQLDTYRQRHPEMAALWDARYTAAILASLARKGEW